MIPSIRNHCVKCASVVLSSRDTTVLCTLMLFLNWYPGVDDPFLSSSLKMTICSKRKTRRSLERDRTPASCSVTKKVSCCNSFPWLVSFPCRDKWLVNTTWSRLYILTLLLNVSLSLLKSHCSNIMKTHAYTHFFNPLEVSLCYVETAK